MTRIGIDVGGTNTDAVLIDGSGVRHGVKTTTTPDVGTGIVTALRRLIAGSGVEPGLVTAVMIGTTHFTNAVVQRRHLARIAAVRIGLPAAATLEPFIDWPPDLRDLVAGPELHGARRTRGGRHADRCPRQNGDAGRGADDPRFRRARCRHLLGVLAAQSVGRAGGRRDPAGGRSGPVGDDVA